MIAPVRMAVGERRRDQPAREGSRYGHGVASNLACVGLAVADVDELQSLVSRVVLFAERIGKVDGIDVMRWEDPSGARLVLGLSRDDVPDLLPSFSARPSARLAAIEYVSPEVANAAVVDDEGEQVTALAIEFEERRLLRKPPAVTDGIAGVTALGVAVEVFANEAAFAGSPASLVDPDREADEPPAHYVERGLKWPPRMAAESFISYGVFEQGSPSAHARLAGTVLEADVRTVELTGQRFVHALVRTIGFDAHVCFPAGDGDVAPSPGAILGGTVFLVGAMARPPASERSRRRWFGRSP